MNLDAEERNGYLVSHEMKKIWDVQLKLVRKLLDVCAKHNLKIWADSGTLLGAVRDHGYIPWDDDIDMAMLREDYDKLLEIAPTEFKEPFFFQDVYTDIKYPRGHAQLRYNGTAAILPCDIHCRFNQSIFVDIFVYDYIPKDKNVLLKAIYKAEFYRNMLNKAVYGKISLCHPRSSLKILIAKAYVTFVGFTKVFEKLQRCYTHYDVKMSNVLSSPMFWVRYLFDIQLKDKWYSNTVYMPFEDIQMPVPVGYHEVLTSMYGDYMTPVQAPTCHGSVIFDTERPYTEVLEDIKSGKIDIKKYMNE